MDLKIKLPKPHPIDMFIVPHDDIPAEWILGRLDKDGKVIEHEAEITIDDKKCIVKLKKYIKQSFELLWMVEVLFMVYYGLDITAMKKVLVAKYGNKINNETLFAVVVFELIEIGS